MQATVTYSTGRWYGNEFGTPNYQLQVKYNRPRYAEPDVDIIFSFATAVGGRGVNYENKGYVTGARLSLSPDEARRLAVSILWQLDQQSETPLTLLFGNHPGQSA